MLPPDAAVRPVGASVRRLMQGRMVLERMSREKINFKLPLVESVDWKTLSTNLIGEFLLFSLLPFDQNPDTKNR